MLKVRTVQVHRNGTITIPKAIRDDMGIKVGGLIKLISDGSGKVSMIPTTDDELARQVEPGVGSKG